MSDLFISTMTALTLNAGVLFLSFITSGSEAGDEGDEPEVSPDHDEEPMGPLTLDILNDADAAAETAQEAAEEEEDQAATQEEDAEEDNDGFVLGSDFKDSPYTVISGYDPAEDVIAVQFQQGMDAEGNPIEPDVSVSHGEDGKDSEIWLNGEPRGMVEDASLDAGDIMLMDVTES